LCLVCGGVVGSGGREEVGGLGNEG
jgi:hypothetical protein